jgi:hypothetical protein
MALYREGKAAMAADGTVTGTGTKWQSSLSLIRPGATIMFLSSPIQMAVVNKVVSDTEIKAITTNGAVVASTDYAILLSDSLTVDGLAQDVAETLRYYQSQETVIADAVEFFKDFDFESLQNLANQIKADSEAAESSATAAAASENAAKTSEANAKSSENAAKNSEVAAENARDQVQQIINDAGEQSTLVALAQPDGFKNIGQCPNVTTLRTKVGAAGQKILLKEYSAGDGAQTGGFLTYVNNTSYPDDGVVFFRVNSSGGWLRDNWSNGIFAEWAGRIVETADASVNLNKISVALKTFNAEVKLPSGNIYIGDTWWITTGQLKITGQGSSTWLIGKSTNKDGVTVNTPIVRISNANWDSVTTNGQYRLQDVDLRDFCISGRNYPLNPTTQTFPQSSRDALFLGGVGWDFQVQRVWFYNLGRRAVVSEDLWDGDFLECKFHEICVDKTFSPADATPQTLVFKRKVDSCNAIRITSCHFEHCYRGAINIQDLCYSFFLLNNKFEAQNQNTDYPIEYPIYVGNNHRNFVWQGGMAVISQQAKYIHYARIWGDATVIRDVKFTAPTNNDGAAILDLSYGNYGVGATVEISADVRGDIVNASSSPVAPILSRLGRNDFSGTNLKLFNPGLTFSLASTSNADDVSKVRIVGIGTNTGAAIVHQANQIHRVNGLRYSGVAYTSLTDVESKADRDEFAMLCNLSTTVTFSMGDTVSSSSLAPSASDGTNTGASASVVGTWMCMGHCPPGKVTLFKRIS